MSFSYWLRNLAALTLQLLAIGVALHVIYGVWSQYVASHIAYQHYQERAEANEKKSADAIAEACSVIPLVNPALRDCLRQQVHSYQKKDTSNKDLQAQQDMAFWALITACVSAGGLLISIGGLYLLYQSLLQTRQAITNDRQIGEAQVRAYLSVKAPTSLDNIKPNKIPTCELRIRNTGQSPAYNVLHLSAMLVRGYPMPDQQGDLFVPHPDSIERGKTLASGAKITVEAKMSRPLTEEEVKSIMTEGDERLYVACIVTYTDVFKRTVHKTRFCAVLIRGVEVTQSKTGMFEGFGWALANVHNDST